MNPTNIAVLAARLADAHGISKAAARTLVDDVFSAIAAAAAAGHEIFLAGFGKFKIKASPARQGRNPATGAAMQIAASKNFNFTAAKVLKDKLNASHERLPAGTGCRSGAPPGGYGPLHCDKLTL